MAATPTSGERLSAGDRREVVLAAAARLFGEHGYAATRLEDIAAAAAVTKPIVYRHFASKKALYLALLERHEEELPRFIAPRLEREDAADHPALMLAILDRWLDYVRANGHAWKMLFRDSSGDAEIRRHRAAVSARARAVMAELIAAGGSRSIPPEQTAPSAEFITSGLAGLALWWIDHPEADKALLIDVATRMLAPAFS